MNLIVQVVIGLIAGIIGNPILAILLLEYIKRKNEHDFNQKINNLTNSKINTLTEIRDAEIEKLNKERDEILKKLAKKHIYVEEDDDGNVVFVKKIPITDKSFFEWIKSRVKY